MPDGRAGSDASRDTATATGAAIALAGVSGFVDAVGVASVSGVFVSFMSGNTTNTGIALGGGDWATVVRVGMSIPLYVVGATAGALVLQRRPAARAPVLAAAAALLLLFLLWSGTAGAALGTRTPATELPAVALLVLPMGLLNSTLRRVGPNPVGLGYVTGTLVSVSEHLAMLIRRRPRAEWAPLGLYAGLWAGFFGGAALGAPAVAAWHALAVLPPVAVLVALTVVDLVRRRTSARQAPASGT